MSAENRKRIVADLVEGEDVNATPVKHKKGNAWGKIQALFYIGVISAIAVYNANRNASEKNEQLSKAQEELSVAHVKVQEALAETDMTPVRSFYANKIIEVYAQNPKYNPQGVLDVVFTAVRKGKTVPIYKMDAVESDIKLLTDKTLSFVPTDSYGVIIGVMKGYAVSKTKGMLDENASSAQVGQAVLDYYALGTQPEKVLAQKAPASKPTGRSRQ